MNLLELQRRMAEDVRRPLTADYEMQRTTDDGTPTSDIAASYISPNNRLTSFERLEIYNRQYWFRLITAVSEDYPTLNALLGTKRFDALILAYLGEHPSASWTLRDLGAKLPAFLTAHPEFGGRRHRLAVDVANLELAYVDAFDGKHLDPLTTEEAQVDRPGLAAFPATALATSRTGLPGGQSGVGREEGNARGRHRKQCSHATRCYRSREDTADKKRGSVSRCASLR